MAQHSTDLPNAIILFLFSFPAFTDDVSLWQYTLKMPQYSQQIFSLCHDLYARSGLC